MRPKVCIVGAAGDTGNLGVTALLHSTLEALIARIPALDITVFDNGYGLRRARLALGGHDVKFALCGLRLSRRFYRPESIINVRVTSRLGGLTNPTAQAIINADAVLDLSAGDSFTDLYGDRRYRMVTQPKRLVSERGLPLFLLPQTYGPFASGRRRIQAAQIVQRARMVWARDADSYERLKQLLGDAYDASRHRPGVDMAFGLTSHEPIGKIDARLRGWLSERGTPLAGVNISGLLANDSAARSRFGLSVDYVAVVHQLVRRLLEDGARVLLVPHVVGRGPESDVHAATLAAAAVKDEYGEQIAVAPSVLGPSEAKWMIGHLDWFCGTRMHSTIAALSSGVPSAAIAYSIKTRGVFETCGMGAEVADARRLDGRSILGTLIDSWRRRESMRHVLNGRLPAVVERAGSQMDAMTHEISALAAGSNWQDHGHETRSRSN